MASFLATLAAFGFTNDSILVKAYKNISNKSKQVAATLEVGGSNYTLTTQLLSTMFTSGSREKVRLDRKSAIHLTVPEEINAINILRSHHGVLEVTR